MPLFKRSAPEKFRSGSAVLRRKRHKQTVTLLDSPHRRNQNRHDAETYVEYADIFYPQTKLHHVYYCNVAVPVGQPSVGVALSFPLYRKECNYSDYNCGPRRAPQHGAAPLAGILPASHGTNLPPCRLRQIPW